MQAPLNKLIKQVAVFNVPGNTVADGADFLPTIQNPA